MIIRVTQEQMEQEISALPDVTSLFHYIEYRLSVMTIPDDLNESQSQAYEEAFVHRCVELYNITHSDEQTPMIRSQEVMNALDSIDSMDVKYLKRFELEQLEDTT